MKRMLIALAVCACAFGQSVVRQSDRLAPEGTEDLYFYDGSSNLEYLCTADTPNVTSVFAVTASSSNQPRTSVAVANITNVIDSGSTSTVTTSVAHGLDVGHRIVIAGATVDTDLNGTYTIATVGSSTTFTITTANVTDATYTDATMLFTTTAPRTNSNVWSIQKLSYSGSTLTRKRWLYGSPANSLACDSRASY